MALMVVLPEVVFHDEHYEANSQVFVKKGVVQNIGESNKILEFDTTALEKRMRRIMWHDNCFESRKSKPTAPLLRDSGDDGLVLFHPEIAVDNV